jgi:hypothetical protein
MSDESLSFSHSHMPPRFMAKAQRVPKTNYKAIDNPNELLVAGRKCFSKTLNLTPVGSTYMQSG